MCGINGIFAYSQAAPPIDRAELLRTRERMARRGPDGAGAWVSADGRVGLGHRRLAIIDLSKAGAQPMTSADGNLAITYNGEIYNYQAIRNDLIAKGCVFRGRSDTEVLLHLYALKGAEMVHDLRGMFAFAIWDSRANSLFLARDPYGVKPLYYAATGGTFRFASQVKALLAGGAISGEPEPAGQVGFYLFGSVPEPFTCYRDISALPAGSAMVVERMSAAEPRQYFSVAKVYHDAEMQSAHGARRSREHGVEDIRSALLDSVRHHLVADVPVGAFLSAGIDSSSLVGLMRDAGQQEIMAVTLTFDDFLKTTDDESLLAAEVAKAYDVKHAVRVVGEAEFLKDLPEILDNMDQPSVDGVNTWFVSKAANELGLKVAISGLGGDELFGGYPSFRDIPRWVRRLHGPSRVPMLGRIARVVGAPVVNRLGVHPKAAGMLEYGGDYAGAYLLRRGLFMPWELPGLLPPDVVAAGLRRLRPLQLIARESDPSPKAAADRISALESGLYLKNQLLRDTDWASMAHSLEVRTPLVDTTLLRQLASVTASEQITRNKSLLAEAPTQPLGEVLKRRPKTGFSTPIAHWQKRMSQEKIAPPIRRASMPWARIWAQIIMACA
ncbi:asparagine synthase (glutamine-hydrolyzing) [Rhodoblastus sphagnicola]|uniref:asparagine synthase (glutamine-hydrolyzing) n=1 Tax=Rhodoblastus sphagnicola TaxID=333368 RepID=A0A2S6NAP3_9HYPH|nr:asparagine synthase (glutamine-hydrolyzing) [Rhodoblastus sphagnicola]MBB4200296.1 asparagine synthase (glutamine-hydrolyzing) [Rhodoblastus sphagnicola]PPQ31679.1 asparagine synthase (glutamine-hydrolyzing) [Rhodoblastus sphagnicola]